MTITITGQILGGKNNIVITRTGKRFPKASWAKWRDAKVSEVRKQWKGQPIDSPTNIRLDYFAGDKRRRDMPAIIDSIFHVLEKACVVTDDTHLWVSESFRGYDKANPRAEIKILGGMVGSSYRKSPDEPSSVPLGFLGFSIAKGRRALE